MNSALDGIKVNLPTPRALSAFVALSTGRRPTKKRRLVTTLRVLCGVSWLIALLVPSCSPLLPFVVATTVGLVFEAVDWRQRSAPNVFRISSRDEARKELLETLNEERVRVGLERVILPWALMVLEASATEWEQIDAMLSTRVWLKQRGYQDRVRGAADEYMLQILETALRDGRGPLLDARQARLSELLRALDGLDRRMFIYPRPDETVSSIPLLPGS